MKDVGYFNNFTDTITLSSNRNSVKVTIKIAYQRKDLSRAKVANQALTGMTENCRLNSHNGVKRVEPNQALENYPAHINNSDMLISFVYGYCPLAVLYRVTHRR